MIADGVVLPAVWKQARRMRVGGMLLACRGGRDETKPKKDEGGRGEHFLCMVGGE